MTYRGWVWSTAGRWWYRIARPGWVEETGAHTFDTAEQAADACRDRMAYLADPWGYTLRAQLAMIRKAAMPRVFDAWYAAQRGRKSDYALAGPAKGA